MQGGRLSLRCTTSNAASSYHDIFHATDTRLPSYEDWQAQDEFLAQFLQDFYMRALLQPGVAGMLPHHAEFVGAARKAGLLEKCSKSILSIFQLEDEITKGLFGSRMRVDVPF